MGCGLQEKKIPAHRGGGTQNFSEWSGGHGEQYWEQECVDLVLVKQGPATKGSLGCERTEQADL